MAEAAGTDYSAEWIRARETLPTALRWLEGGFERGDHVGIQMSVEVRDGEPLVASAGLAAPDVAMRDDTLGILLCASKPMLAAALVRAMEQGLLALTDPLGRFLPELRETSLGGISLADCVSHSISGSRATAAEPDLFAPLPLAVRLIAETYVLAGAGGTGSVQYLSWPFTLTGRVLENVFGRPLQDVMRQEVFLPLGMTDSWLGMPATTAKQYEAEGRLAVLYDCTGAEPRPKVSPNPEWAIPSAGVRAPSTDIAKFYRELLAAREGRSNDWISQSGAWAMTARHRVGVPEAGSGAMIDFGLGVELESRHYDKFWMSYGPHCAISTFGHKGESCFLSFCDPRTKALVVVFVNGQIEGMAHGQRMFRLAEKIYEDLGLA
ncbi:serine hydrolase domain-containing protein [Kitasatospora kifunensis]|uniref:CubicO group peptidase (Beta-lactamase class C family) n=1 Tax=Kitasatospora kifunensis TaxID=58351 RepID=A0A7W7VXR8_KITKI|nr:serine hydrolase domain-containing protein [Kitasatospora kifunensis]MBB4926922.1 CubicO group peptidase (beta-lactamase class C family) [Kitasatospora kifunensis]